MEIPWNPIWLHYTPHTHTRTHTFGHIYTYINIYIYTHIYHTYIIYIYTLICIYVEIDDMKFQMCLLLFVATPHHLHNTGRHPAISHSTFPPGGVPFAGQWLKGLTYLLMPFSRMGACFSIQSWIMMVCYYMLHWLTNIDLYCQTWLPLIFLGQVMCCSSSFSWFLWTMRNHWGVLLNFSILARDSSAKKPLALPVGHLGWRAQWCHAGPQAQGRRGAGDCRSQTEWICKEEKVAGRTQWICWFILRVLFFDIFLCSMFVGYGCDYEGNSSYWVLAKRQTKNKEDQKSTKKKQRTKKTMNHIYFLGVFFSTKTQKKAKTKEHILGGILLFLLFFFSRGKNKKETKKNILSGRFFCLISIFSYRFCMLQCLLCFLHQKDMICNHCFGHILECSGVCSWFI